MNGNTGFDELNPDYANADYYAVKIEDEFQGHYSLLGALAEYKSVYRYHHIEVAAVWDDPEAPTGRHLLGVHTALLNKWAGVQ